ncbi:MAG: WG repeat-containing protein [Ruminococcus sp.]|jgi:predicted nucleic acid-binding protein
MKKSIILLMTVLLGLAWYLAVSETAGALVKAKEHMEKAAELEKKEIYVDAVLEYENALEYDPDNEDIYLHLADASLNSGDADGFISVCEKAAETFQDSTKALDTLMNYYLDNDYEERAVKYLENFIEEYPENQNARAWFEKLKGSYTELYCYYEELGEIVNHSMVVLEEGKYGLADAVGNEIIPCEYKEIYPFSEEGFALAQRDDGTWIYIDENNQVRKAPENEYDVLGMYTEEGTTARRNGKYGFLDENMEPIGEFVWDGLTGLKNGVAAAQRDGEWSLITPKGKERSQERYEDVISDDNGFCSWQKRIFVKKDGEYQMVNTKGKAVGELTFDLAKAFTDEGYAAVCKDGKWGYINEDGELVLDFQYDDAQSFQNGFAAVCIDGKWGYIDEQGTVVIQPEFLMCSHISDEGTAAVQAEEGGDKIWKLLQLNLFQ